MRRKAVPIDSNVPAFIAVHRQPGAGHDSPVELFKPSHRLGIIRSTRCLLKLPELGTLEPYTHATCQMLYSTGP